MKLPFLTLFLLYGIFIFAKNKDTTYNSLIFNYTHKNIYAIEQNEPYISPIRNNKMNSYTLNYDFNILNKYKYKLRGNFGLNTNFITFGYSSNSNLLEQNISSFSSKFIDFNIQNSIYLERKVFRIKSVAINLSFGLLSNGLLNGNYKNEKSFVYRNIFNKNDEIIISRKQNNLYKLYPFLQLKANSSINGLFLTYGSRLIIGSEYSENMNYDYQIIQDRQFYTLRNGQFKDNSLAFEFFIGINPFSRFVKNI